MNAIGSWSRCPSRRRYRAYERIAASLRADDAASLATLIELTQEGADATVVQVGWAG